MLLNNNNYLGLILLCLAAMGFATDHPIQIETCEQLQGIGTTTGPLHADYIQVANVDCSHMTHFSPIGNEQKPFTGSYDGQGYTIHGLVIQQKKFVGSLEKGLSNFSELAVLYR